MLGHTRNDHKHKTGFRVGGPGFKHHGQPVKRIPVTLVTGFLGAGKTTLLNHVLGADTGLRFAVIENEFGDVGMDGSLLDSACDVLFELNDGCVCCSVRQDLIEVFEGLIERRGEVDHVIIETTGLAEPGPVMRIFDIPNIQQVFELDGVVTVVDAAHIESSLDDVTACLEQVAYADVLILNKIDCVGAESLGAIEAHLRQINPLASIVRAEHSQIEVASFLSVRGESNEPRLSVGHGGHGHDHHHDHGHDDHSHDDGIQAVVVELPGDVDVAALDVWLGNITRQSEPALLRMKGVLSVPGDPRRFVFNGVRSAVDVRPGRPWGEDSRFCRIVMIGRSLDLTVLQAGLAACSASPSAEA